MPPCAEGTAVGLDATGKGDYPAFSIQAQCIAPLVVTNPTITLESGKTFTLTWTPSGVACVPHHGLLRSEPPRRQQGPTHLRHADTGSLAVSGTLLESLMALGVTG